MRPNEKRERLLLAAESLIHHQGYRVTTLADIAQAAEVQLGNVYYYFKTKDALAVAIIHRHAEMMRQKLVNWDQLPHSRARLEAFLDMALENRELYALQGCPIGSLSQELNKGEPTLAVEVNRILRMQVDWTITQFRELGKVDPQLLGARFIAQIQGAVLLSNAFQDPELMIKLMEQCRTWLKDI